MQPTQDKDFDKLFKAAFEDAEITPSRDLWSNIESEIEPKKKRIIPVYWLSAAAVLLVATVGFLVYQQQNTNKQDKNLANNTIENNKPVAVAQPGKDSSTTVVKPVEEVKQTLPVSTKAVTSLAKTTVKKEVKVVEKQRIITAPVAQKQETMVAKVEEPKKDIRTKIEEAILQPEKETVIAAIPTTTKIDDSVSDNEEQTSKSIRNVGDVVNLIVNKVDKRKDKFIQFRTDDDDSSLSSINIGPFKIGKRKK